MIGDERTGQCGAVGAVFVVDVGNDFVAALVFEIHIDIGRLIAFAADEAFKQH